MPVFQSLVKNLPNKPGVYRFYGLQDDLLYIGKAKNLKNRVSSYFQEGRPKNQRLSLMISQIHRVEYTIVETEKESLILEANLIHELQPKYNILLKDDRNYIYLRITNGDPIPGIFLTRRRYDPKSDYFGPYTKKFGITDLLRTLRIIFPYCQERFPQKKPCPYVGLRQCNGICVGKETREDYIARLEQIKNILSGNFEPADKFIRDKMTQASLDKNYELAALWRDRLSCLKETVEDQKIILPHPQDLDIITIIIEKPDSDGLQIASSFVQNIRKGKMVNLGNFLLSGSEDSETEENTLKWINNQTSKEKEPDQISNSEISFNFVRRFLNSYYAWKKDSVQILLQIWEDK